MTKITRGKTGKKELWHPENKYEKENEYMKILQDKQRE